MNKGNKKIEINKEKKSKKLRKCRLLVPMIYGCYYRCCIPIPFTIKLLKY